MERRGFLSFLGLGVAGAMLPDVVKIVPHLFSVERVAPNLEAVNIQTITEAFSAEFEREYRRLMGQTIVYPSSLSNRIGDTVVRAGKQIQLDAQHHVMFEPWQTVEGMRERYILPCAQALAHSCARKELNVFGTLNVPSNTDLSRYQAGCVVKTNSSSIRGLCHSYYDVYRNEQVTLVRFDAIGGRA